jgi:tetratricopeptide (TPR) repeat protein
MPDYWEAHLSLGMALAKIGRIRDAADQFEQAAQWKPDSLDAYANLTTAYAQLQEPAKAIAAAEKTMALARSAGKLAMAQQIDLWLTKYRAQQASAGGSTRPRDAVAP